MSWVRHRAKAPPPPTDWNAPVHVESSDLLERLYEWERRCRGYALYPSPVLLEPEFVSLREVAGGEGAGASLPALPSRGSSALSFLPLTPPLDQKVTVPHAAGLLGALGGVRSPLAFEVIGNGREVVFQMTTARTESGEVAATLGMHFPRWNGVPDIKRGGDSTGRATNGAGSEDVLRGSLHALRDCSLGCRVVEFGLLRFAFQPLQLFTAFAPDPLAGVVAALGQLGEGEVAGLQLLFTPASDRWATALLQLASALDDGSLPSWGKGHDAGLLSQAREKMATPLFACAVRVFALSAEDDASSPVGSRHSRTAGDARAFALCQKIGGALGTVADPAGNSLLALDADPVEDGSYPEEERFRDILSRQTRRPGMLLSAGELAGLIHPPAESLQHPRLRRFDPTERPLPPHLRLDSGEDGAILGLHSFRGEMEGVLWPESMRTRHAYMLGATRMGKSTLLLNLIAQDLEEGRGLCLIDPHGDLARDVLRLVTPSYESDVLYLDFADTAYPPALGLLTATDEWEKRLLVSDLLAILHRVFSSSWGDRLEHILRHALLTLLADDGQASGRAAHTLRDIRPLLSSPAYREEILTRLDDPGLRSFWQSEFSSYSASAFSPVYNKLGLLLSSPLVRNAVAGHESRLDPDALMQGRKILVVNLAQGLIGEDNAHFLGALLVSKLQLAAMHALRRGRDARIPFTLYVDEFQNFVVSSFEKILSEAGKAGLSLVLANQFLEQLGDGLQTAILSNVGALISFRVSAHSGSRLQGEFGGYFGAKELTDLERGHAVARLGKAGDSFLLRTFAPPDELQDHDPGAAIDRIVEQTRATLCRPRAEVEAELRQAEDELQELTRAYDEKAKLQKAGTGKKAPAKTRSAPEPEYVPPHVMSSQTHPVRVSPDTSVEPPSQDPKKTAASSAKTEPVVNHTVETEPVEPDDVPVSRRKRLQSRKPKRTLNIRTQAAIAKKVKRAASPRKTPSRVGKKASPAVTDTAVDAVEATQIPHLATVTAPEKIPAEQTNIEEANNDVQEIETVEAPPLSGEGASKIFSSESHEETIPLLVTPLFFGLPDGAPDEPEPR